MRIPIILTSVAVAAVAASGCGGRTAGHSSTSHAHRSARVIAHAGGASSVVVEINIGGGLELPEIALGTIPALILYGDGTLLLDAGSSGAIADVTAARLSERGIQRVLARARSIGLLRAGIDYGMPHVYDAPSTSLQITTAAGRFEHDAAELGFDDTVAEGLTATQVSRRMALKRFDAWLLGAATWGRPYVDVAAHDWTAPALTVRRVRSGSVSQAGPRVAIWPLAQSPAACLVLTGRELALVRRLAATQTSQTSWTVGSTAYTLAFRPVLPGDRNGCP